MIIYRTSVRASHSTFATAAVTALEGDRIYWMLRQRSSSSASENPLQRASTVRVTARVSLSSAPHRRHNTYARARTHKGPVASSLTWARFAASAGDRCRGAALAPGRWAAARITGSISGSIFAPAIAGEVRTAASAWRPVRPAGGGGGGFLRR